MRSKPGIENADAASEDVLLQCRATARMVSVSPTAQCLGAQCTIEVHFALASLRHRQGVFWDVAQSIAHSSCVPTHPREGTGGISQVPFPEG